MTALLSSSRSNPSVASLSTVLSGTFHRAPEQLRATFEALSLRYHVLSPQSVDWVDLSEEFVRLPSEQEETLNAVEGRHLSAVRAADFVWLFCPEGYVGRSATMEIGYAQASGVPVLTDCLPTDPVLASMVTLVPSVDQAATALVPRPGQGLAPLQRYYARIAERRGWSEESARDTLLLMTEEIGELARAVRKQAGLARDDADNLGPVGHELADVQLYLVHLANALGVDLAEAVTEKESLNAARHARREPAA